MNKNKFYDYRNQSLWDRIRFDARYINFKFIVRVLFWKRMRDLYDCLTYPWWLLQWWYSCIVSFIYWVPRFIKSIPGMPKRWYLATINWIKVTIKNVFTNYIYLRKRTWKDVLVFQSKYLLVWYFGLSFIDEFKYHTDHHFFEINKWWTWFFEIGFHWAWCSFWFWMLIVLFILYFIGWRYWFKTYWTYYWWLTYGAVDLFAPDMAHEALFMLIQTCHLPTYIFCGYYCWVMNDLVDNYYHGKKPLPSYTLYSWEYDHFTYRLKDEKNPEVREKLSRTLKYIKLRDKANRWLGTF